MRMGSAPACLLVHLAACEGAHGSEVRAQSPDVDHTATTGSTSSETSTPPERVADPEATTPENTPSEEPATPTYHDLLRCTSDTECVVFEGPCVQWYAVRRGEEPLAQRLLEQDVVERPHEPCLLDLRERAAVVDLEQAQLRVDRAHLVDARREPRPPERARRAHSLEPVDDLEPGRIGEEQERRELPVLFERSAHRRERRALAEAQRREALTQLAHVDHVRLAGLGHAALEALRAAADRGSCVTASPDSSRNHASSPPLAARGSCVTGVGARPEFRANRPRIPRRSRSRLARDRASALSTNRRISSRDAGHLDAQGGA